MKILVDENIPLTTVRALRTHGHDVLDIRGTADEGIPDYALWEMAQCGERLLITTVYTIVNSYIMASWLSVFGSQIGEKFTNE